MHVGLIGFGSAGQRHAFNLKGMTNFRDDIYLHVMTRDQDRIYPLLHEDVPHKPEHRTNALNIADCTYDDFGEFISKPLDKIVVATPTADHPRCLQWTTARGIPCYMEKPLARRREDIDPSTYGRIITNPNLLHVGFQSFHDPQLHLLHSKFRDEWFDATVIWLEDITKVHPWEDWRKGYAVNKSLGGGIVGCFSHELAHIIYLFGYPHVISIEDVLFTPDTDVEMGIELSMTFEKGNVHVRFSFCHTHDPVREIFIEQRNSTIKWDQIGHTLHFQEKGIPYTVLSHEPNYRNRIFANSLMSFIENGKHNTPVPHSGFALKVLDLQTEILDKIGV